MIVNGRISLDTEKQTITLHLENGSYGIDLFPNGVKNWLEIELDCLKKQKSKEAAARRQKLHEEINALLGIADTTYKQWVDEVFKDHHDGMGMNQEEIQGLMNESTWEQRYKWLNKNGYQTMKEDYENSIA